MLINNLSLPAKNIKKSVFIIFLKLLYLVSASEFMPYFDFSMVHTFRLVILNLP
jgi:hypothetical protein